VQRGSAGAATFLSPGARKRANEVGGAVAPSGGVNSAAPFCDLCIKVWREARATLHARRMRCKREMTLARRERGVYSDVVMDSGA
jgi:hypothetical protein